MATRLEKRVEFQTRVEAYPLDGRDPPSEGVTTNLSYRGVFILACTYLPAMGTILIVKIHTPHGKLKLAARVVHNIEEIGFGCRFMDLTTRQVNNLNVLLAGHPSPSHTDPLPPPLPPFDDTDSGVRSQPVHLLVRKARPNLPR